MGTQVRSDCGNRLEDCGLRMGGRAMDWDVIFYDVVIFLQPPVLEGKRGREIGHMISDLGCIPNTRLVSGYRFRHH